MTAQEVDYYEVFRRLVAVDESAAEKLLDVATVILERDRRINALKEVGRTTGDPELDWEGVCLRGALDEVGRMHQRLLKKDRAYADENGDSVSSVGPGGQLSF